MIKYNIKPKRTTHNFRLDSLSKKKRVEPDTNMDDAVPVLIELTSPVKIPSSPVDTVTTEDITQTKTGTKGRILNKEGATQLIHDCNYCNKAFPKRKNTEDDVLIHLYSIYHTYNKILHERDEKPQAFVSPLPSPQTFGISIDHQCPKCFKVYEIRADLNDHILKVHNSIKPVENDKSSNGNLLK